MVINFIQHRARKENQVGSVFIIKSFWYMIKLYIY